MMGKTIGSVGWVRTTDQQLNRLLLYRLSYHGTFLTLAGLVRFELSMQLLTACSLSKGVLLTTQPRLLHFI